MAFGGAAGDEAETPCQGPCSLAFTGSVHDDRHPCRGFVAVPRKVLARWRVMRPPPGRADPRRRSIIRGARMNLGAPPGAGFADRSRAVFFQRARRVATTLDRGAVRRHSVRRPRASDDAVVKPRTIDPEPPPSPNDAGACEPRPGGRAPLATPAVHSRFRPYAPPRPSSPGSISRHSRGEPQNKNQADRPALVSWSSLQYLGTHPSAPT